jgi:cell division protein FtsN
MEIIPPEIEDDEDFEEVSTPFYKRKSSFIAGLIIAALLIWMIWPTSQHSKIPADSSPTPSTQSSIPPSAIPVPTPTKDNSVIRPGQDTTVPNLIGLTQTDAEKQARAAELHYNYIIEFNKEAAKGTVFKQDPAAGAQATKWDNVTFWVSK